MSCCVPRLYRPRSVASGLLLLAATAASAAGSSDDLQVALPGGEEMAFVLVQPGRFTMGTPEAQRRELERQRKWDSWSANEQPAHEVTISSSFYLGATEVTQAQWEAVMGTRPWADSDAVAHRDHPAVNVSWPDVQQLIARLNQVAGSDLYRLPTEAEWEYASRAGSPHPWSFGKHAGQLDLYAWYHGNTWALGKPVIHPVATRRPNRWGLFDMHGNAWEWCLDWYAAGYYSRSPAVDPAGPATGTTRVLRGGVFPHVARWARAAGRARLAPGYREGDVGVRLVRRR